MVETRELTLNSDWTRRAFSDAPSGPPFSFVLGGRPSSEFLGTWKREEREESVDPATTRRTVTVSDPASGLEVRAVCSTYLDTPGVDWTLHFTNNGGKDSELIEQVRAVDASIPIGTGVNATLHRLKGSTCVADDWLPFDEPLAEGQRIEFAATSGRSSNVCPFFNLDWGSGGVITAIGWSGQWSAAVERKDGMLRVQAGVQNLRLRLRPGETIRTPRIMRIYWLGNDTERAYNLWRDTMLRRIVPQQDGAPATPPIAHLSTSFYELNASTEANVLSHLESIKDLGFEIFWLDAYWTRDGFPNGMGHYGLPIDRAEPKDRFPRGLRPISDAAGAAGMGFLMWFEPERVAPGTAIAKEHPEWVISPNNDGSGLYNLGIPDARAFMTEYLKTVIREYNLAWLRIDFNIDPLPFWQFLNEKDAERVGLAETRYVEGLYQMWDDLRAAFPRLMIDNCASGGRRIDLETCARSIPLWRTDATIDPLMKGDFNQAALQNQVMTAGLSRYVPFNVSGQMGATPYLFRSGFNAGISFCEDCRPPNYPRDVLKKAIEEAKRIRKYYAGHMYVLSEVTTSAKDWCVLQYHRPEQSDGMVIAFRRHQSPYSAFDCKLGEISTDARYTVTFSPNCERGEARVMSGEALQHVAAAISECPGSLLIEYAPER